MMQNQTVLVTGAEGALGGVVVRRFADAGANVIATHHTSYKGALPEMRGVRWVSVDLANSESVRKTLEALSALDGLVHCAGGFRWSHVDGTSDADFDFLVNVNLRSTFYLLRAVLPGMKKRNFGRIVLVSARATLAPPAGMGAYAATKGGINALVAAAADEVRSFNINVNAVLPTIIDTPANRKEMPKADTSAWVTAEQLADVILSLTQPVGKPINGALVPVAGRL